MGMSLPSLPRARAPAGTSLGRSGRSCTGTGAVGSAKGRSSGTGGRGPFSGTIVVISFVPFSLSLNLEGSTGRAHMDDTSTTRRDARWKVEILLILSIETLKF